MIRRERFGFSERERFQELLRTGRLTDRQLHAAAYCLETAGAALQKSQQIYVNELVDCFLLRNSDFNEDSLEALCKTTRWTVGTLYFGLNYFFECQYLIAEELFQHFELAELEPDFSDFFAAVFGEFSRILEQTRAVSEDQSTILNRVITLKSLVSCQEQCGIDLSALYSKSTRFFSEFCATERHGLSASTYLKVEQLTKVIVNICYMNLLCPYRRRGSTVFRRHSIILSKASSLDPDLEDKVLNAVRLNFLSHFLQD